MYTVKITNNGKSFQVRSLSDLIERLQASFTLRDVSKTEWLVTLTDKQ